MLNLCRCYAKLLETDERRIYIEEYIHILNYNTPKLNKYQNFAKNHKCQCSSTKIT